jgi:hypothetical protein
VCYPSAATIAEKIDFSMFACTYFVSSLTASKKTDFQFTFTKAMLLDA